MPTSPPIITLTSDFGLRDAYVATVKGVILSVCRDAVIVDVTHQVPAQDVAHGAFVIADAYDSYPSDAVHVCVVDPGVGTGRRAVALVTPRGLFVAPDNGLLTRVVAKLLAQASVDLSTQDPGFLPVPPGCKAYVLQEPKYWRSTVSNTFHGRDVFAPVAAHLANGVKPANLGVETDVLVALPEQLPEILFNSVKGAVVYVDSFGNLITNIAGEAIGQGEAVVEVGGRRIEGPVRTFADTDGLMALVGSFGFLEIALRDGSAAAELGVRVGETVRVSLVS
jgi:S-adenosyl-L-methionine hydrolase (adenosine-forming)